MNILLWDAPARNLAARVDAKLARPLHGRVQAARPHDSRPQKSKLIGEAQVIPSERLLAFANGRSGSSAATGSCGAARAPVFTFR